MRLLGTKDFALTVPLVLVNIHRCPLNCKCKNDSQFNINDLIINILRNVLQQFAIQMKIFYAFIHLLFGKECCFSHWTDWNHNSMTCGEVCSSRKRKVFSWEDVILQYHDYCTSYYSSCGDWTQWQTNCEKLDCRKFFSNFNNFIQTIFIIKSLNALRISNWIILLDNLNKL